MLDGAVLPRRDRAGRPAAADEDRVRRSAPRRRRETGEPHAPAEAQPDNQQAFTCCFAIDYLDGEDHTIDRPAEYDFWRDYVPELTPAWPGKLLSWQMTDPITLEDRAT